MIRGSRFVRVSSRQTVVDEAASGVSFRNIDPVARRGCYRPEVPEQRVVAEVSSSFGSGRVTISLTAGTIEIERWGRGPAAQLRAVLEPAVVAKLEVLAHVVRAEEQAQMVGDFYRMGEERLRIELGGRTIELHNDSDRIRTPGAEPLLVECWALADRLLPPSR